MSKGERFWIVEVNLTYCIEVDINAKGGVFWHYFVGIDVNRLEVLLVMCLVMDDWLMLLFVGIDVNILMTKSSRGDVVVAVIDIFGLCSARHKISIN